METSTSHSKITFRRTGMCLQLILVVWCVLNEVTGTVTKGISLNNKNSPSDSDILVLPIKSSRADSTVSMRDNNEHSDLDEKFDWYHPLLRPCALHVPDDKNIILSYSGQPNQKLGTSIPHGKILVARCPALGKMKLYGASTIICSNGKWSTKFPTCLPTTPSDNFSRFLDDHPPQIIASVPGGAAGESDAGELVVRPESAVHLDCIFYRRLGNPSWDRKNLKYSKRFAKGWAVSPKEKLWRYRISIFSIQPEDEGEYTCKTPQGHTNSIRIIVQTIKCPQPATVELPLRRVLEGTYAGQRQIYSCSEGYVLHGPNSSQCLTSGIWSERSFPNCELIQCSYDIDGADPRLEFDFLNGVGFNAMVKFSCPPGYHLNGARNATCKEDLSWHPSPPICSAVECSLLLPPLNGRIIDSGSSHFVGDIIKFACNRNFQLVGPTEITCNESGTWSHPPPTCQIVCASPGVPSFGSLSPNKPFYETGTTLHINCDPGYKLHGKSWLLCQQDGSWSTTVGTCKRF